MNSMEDTNEKKADDNIRTDTAMDTDSEGEVNPVDGRMSTSALIRPSAYIRSDLHANPDELRAVMRQWTTGVTVVTSAWQGEQHGMTVSSFTSISLTPPLVLVSLAQDTRTFRLIQQSRTFGVSILGEAQADLSRRFAGQVSDDADRFDGLNIKRLLSGVPLLDGAIAWLDCHVFAQFEAGNTMVFVGKVVAAEAYDAGLPLVYYQRDYHFLGR